MNQDLIIVQFGLFPLRNFCSLFDEKYFCVVNQDGEAGSGIGYIIIMEQKTQIIVQIRIQA